jgi:hypothetical protein
MRAPRSPPDAPATPVLAQEVGRLAAAGETRAEDDRVLDRLRRALPMFGFSAWRRPRGA